MSAVKVAVEVLLSFVISCRRVWACEWVTKVVVGRWLLAVTSFQRSEEREWKEGERSGSEGKQRVEEEGGDEGEGGGDKWRGKESRKWMRRWRGRGSWVTRKVGKRERRGEAEKKKHTHMATFEW